MEDPGGPVIGITPAFDDGTDMESLRPNVALNFVDTAYPRAVERAGGTPVMLPLTTHEVTIERYLQMLDGLICSGGGGFLRRRHLRQQVLPDLRTLAPRRFTFETLLLTKALQMNLPVLGICRGHQMIIRITGGRCYSQISDRIPAAMEHYCEELPIGRRPVHGIQLGAESHLRRILGRDMVQVNSLHRQAARSVRPPLEITARAEDGVIEAVESRAHDFVMGVQFHPELMSDHDAPWSQLFTALTDAAVAYRRNLQVGEDSSMAHPGIRPVVAFEGAY